MIENNKIIFNLSPSSISLYIESQLLFYYNYIVSVAPDTIVSQVYGVAGSLTHDVLQKYAENINNGFDIVKYFDEQWTIKKLDSELDMFGRVLNKSKYIKAISNGKKILDGYKKYNFKCEEEIVFPLIDNEKYLINVKGFIDLQIIKNDEHIVLDWKTSSSSNEDDYKKLLKDKKIVIKEGIIYFLCEVEDMPAFAKQILHYSYSIYKKYNIIPSEFRVEYIKINKTKAYHFSENQIKSYEHYLNRVVNEIMFKGDDINSYEIGDITSIFNEHKQKCLNEVERRKSLKDNENKLILVEKNKKILLFKNFDDKLIKYIDKKYSYFVDGYHFSEKFKKRQWDGKKHFLRKIKDIHYLPAGFKTDVINFLKDYVKHFNLNLEVKYVDKDEHTLIHSNSLPDKLEGIKLYDFQVEAVDKCLKNERGVLFCSVSAGKTEIAAELIRRLDVKTLFLVHRKELLIQTYNRFKERGLDKNGLLGMIGEGECNYNNFINVGMIQTLYSRMNDNDVSNYLNEIKLVIVDEFHHAMSDSYKRVLDKINSKYIFGMTGSIPEKKNYELELKSVSGDILYRIDSKTLMNKKIISKPRCIMYRVNHDYETGSWPDLEKSQIIRNKKRNNIIKEICEKEEGVKVIIVKKIEHGEILNELIPNSVFTYGCSEDEERKRVMEELEKGEIKILISTLVGEGVSINRIENLIIACGMGRSSIPTIQQAGRALRKFYDENNKLVEKRIFDFYDENVDYLEEHSKLRKREYEKYTEVELK